MITIFIASQLNAFAKDILTCDCYTICYDLIQALLLFCACKYNLKVKRVKLNMNRLNAAILLWIRKMFP